MVISLYEIIYIFQCLIFKYFCNIIVSIINMGCLHRKNRHHYSQIPNDKYVILAENHRHKTRDIASWENVRDIISFHRRQSSTMLLMVLQLYLPGVTGVPGNMMIR